MFVDFFIRRPIFATVCSLLIILAGVIALPNLAVEEYPQITPPQVTVTSNYIGASAQTVESSVTIPLEQQINGVPGMKYMSSTSGNDGTSVITITFDLERDVDLACVDVQNRVATAQGRLPQEIKTTGITVAKSTSAFLMGVGLGCLDNRYTNLFVSNYADRYIRDNLKRVKGVSDVQIFGERKYAMRLWVDPARLAQRHLTAMDVSTALAEQNVQVAAGQIGQPPNLDNQNFQMSVQATGRLKNPREFEEIVIRTGADGALIKVKDIGRAELGAEDYGTFLRFNGMQAVGLGISSLPSANALDVAKGVNAELKRLSESFPPGLQYMVAFDATKSVDASIHEVIITLLQAIGLVVLVIFVFLQSGRSTFIPAITIPVSLVGTFALMKVLGFSINTLTLFGITLATGLVVDDAIVVIENIARIMRDRHLDARQASSQAMEEVTGAVIATSLVLAAVFIPVAFLPGTTGQLYKQFALTISLSVGLSAFNALTLTPALSALWLSNHHESEHGIFGLVNKFLNWLKNAYASTLTLSLKLKPLIIALFLAGLAASYWLLQVVPSAFIPTEDQGYFFIIVQGPDGVSTNYTERILSQVEAALKQFPEIKGTFAVGGFGFSGNAPNNGFVAATLSDWKERPRPDQTLESLLTRVRGELSKITGASVFAFTPPAIQGLGAFGGFFYELQDRKGTSIQDLAKAAFELIGKANQEPSLRGVSTQFKSNTPQLIVEVDREKSKNVRVSIADVFSTLQVFLGSQYVNDFTLDNRIYRVYVQADKQFRANPKNIEEFYVRSQTGAMVPLANIVHVSRLIAPPIISHFNMSRSVEINGVSAPGFSTGQAMESMERLSKQMLPNGMSYEWSGISKEQHDSEGQAGIIFALGIIFVFLVLAAQYESFTDPLIILLAVPVAILGALGAQSLRHLDNDVFCQIGLVMLIGLASKNAILIVEFANQLRRKGLTLNHAVVESAGTRLRPILMTSFAFILGILPLVLATGAGAASRRSLGTAVFGGMIVSTFLNLYIVPTLYVLVNQWLNRGGKRAVAQDPERVDVDEENGVRDIGLQYSKES
ncbi:MAG TPA: multidrug efflux RND transporter permease subunit [Oculatellaceae cyanobacterium]